MNLELYKKIKCSEKEKRELFELITTIVSFSEKVRREGILALEDDVSDLEDYLFKQGIQLVVDGTNPETVEKILRSYIDSSGYTGKKLLKQILISEGILAIQKKDNPRIVKERLIAFLGEESAIISLKEFGSELTEEEEMQEKEESEKILEYLNSIQDKPPFSKELSLLEDKILVLSDPDLYKVYREIQNDDLIISLKVASGKVIKRIFDTYSMSGKKSLKHGMDRIKGIDKKEILEAQQKILDEIKKLEDLGWIKIMNPDDYISFT